MSLPSSNRTVGRSSGSRVVAHRGSSLRHRENTLEAFAGADREGAHGLEFDVRRSADGVLVVHHDPDLGDGRIVSRTPSAQLPKFIPTLAEVLSAHDGLWLNVEIKNDADEPDYDSTGETARAVVAEVVAHRQRSSTVVPGDVVISSFDEPTVAYAVDAYRTANAGGSASDRAGVGFGFLVWRGDDEDATSVDAVVAGALDAAAELGCTAIHPHDLLVTAAGVADAHRRGLEVNVWTVDDPDRLQVLAGYGVNGLITNDPAGALVALKQ